MFEKNLEEVRSLLRENRPEEASARVESLCRMLKLTHDLLGRILEMDAGDPSLLRELGAIIELHCADVQREAGRSDTERTRARAHAAAERGDWNEAADLFGKAVDLDPRAAALHFNRGLCAWAAERFDVALAAFHRAAELEPGDAAMGKILAEALLLRGREAEGVRALEAVLDHHPDERDVAACLDALTGTSGGRGPAAGPGPSRRRRRPPRQSAETRVGTSPASVEPRLAS